MSFRDRSVTQAKLQSLGSAMLLAGSVGTVKKQASGELSVQPRISQSGMWLVPCHSE